MTTTAYHQHLNIPTKGTNQTDNDVLVKGGFFNTKNYIHIHEATTKEEKSKEKNISSIIRKKKKNRKNTTSKKSTTEPCPCTLVSLLHIGSKKHTKYSDPTTRKQVSAMTEQHEDDIFSISNTATTLSLHSSDSSTSMHHSIDETEPRLRLRNYYNVRQTKEALYNGGPNDDNKQKKASMRKDVQHEQQKELNKHPLLKKDDPLLSAEVSSIVGAPLSKFSAPSSSHDSVLQSTTMMLSSEAMASAPTIAASPPSPPPPSQQDQPELVPLIFRGAFVSTWDNLLYSLDKEETSPLSRSGRTRRSREILEVERRLRNTATSQFLEISHGIQQADKISSMSSTETTALLRVEENLHPISNGDGRNNYVLEEAPFRSLHSNCSCTLEGYIDNQ